MTGRLCRVGILAAILSGSAIPGYPADDYFKIDNRDNVQYTVYIFENSMTGKAPGIYHNTTRQFYVLSHYRVVVPAGKSVGFDTAWIKAKINNRYDHIYKLVLEGGGTPNRDIPVRTIQAGPRFAYDFLETPDTEEFAPERNWYGLHAPCTIVIKDKALTLSPR
jgi:hypothetical protein